MREYTCTKCGAVCDVWPEDDHPGMAESWCDECDDYPGGWLGKLSDKGEPPCIAYGVDFLTDMIDRAKDIAKDRKMGL